jgi:hypothetical protein
MKQKGTNMLLLVLLQTALTKLNLRIFVRT